MKVKLSNWFTLALFLAIISEVYLVSPPSQYSRCANDKSDHERTTKYPDSLVCQPGEVLVESPPCCEPTCFDDCKNVKCPLIYVRRPTCVCKPGLVRYNGVCIEPWQCPAKEEEEPEPLPPMTTPKSDDVPYQQQSSGLGCQTCNSVPVKPPGGCQSKTPRPPCPCQQNTHQPPCACQATGLPCPCQATYSCYPPPPVAPPNPCGTCCGSK